MTTVYKTAPTNKYHMYCGPPHAEMLKCLQNLDPVSKKSRIEWLQQLANTPLPSGPYPVLLSGRGWFQGFVCDPHYQACYVLRDDMNLDVEVFKILRDADNVIVKRVPVKEEDDAMIALRVSKGCWEFYERAYPEEAKRKITPRWEFARVTPEMLKRMMCQEIRYWPVYDKEMTANQRLMERLHQANPKDGSQAEAVCRGNLEAYLREANLAQNPIMPALLPPAPPALALRKTKRRLFPQQEEGPEGPEPVKKKPKVRFVTKLDKVTENLDQVNKEMASVLWLLNKLNDPKALQKSLVKKPRKTAAALFEHLPKAAVVHIALKLAENCVLDALENAVGTFRRTVLETCRAKYNIHCQKAIESHNQLVALRKETERSPNAVDDIPMENFGEDEGPEGPAAEKEGPEGPAAETEGPAAETEKTEGPAKDVGSEDAELSTPAPVGREHWIKSGRSSSGYKGVMKCRETGRWRVKHKGNTIGRLDSLEEACEFYYQWNVSRGYIKDFRLI